FKGENTSHTQFFFRLYDSPEPVMRIHGACTQVIDPIFTDPVSFPAVDCPLFQRFMDRRYSAYPYYSCCQDMQGSPVPDQDAPGQSGQNSIDIRKPAAFTKIGGYDS